LHTYRPRLSFHFEGCKIKGPYTSLFFLLLNTINIRYTELLTT